MVAPSLFDSLAGIGNFLLYFVVSLILLIVFKSLYLWVTPYDELKLIRSENNVAAATAFGGALVGFCLALGSAVTYSLTILDFVIWGAIATAAQILVFVLVRQLLLRDIVKQIRAGEVAAGVALASLSVAVGLLNAACMSY